MTVLEYCAIGALFVSLLSLAISLYVFFYKHRNSQADRETICLDRISDARYKYSSLVEKIVEPNQISEEKKTIFNDLLQERIEDYLNALDFACQRYLKGFLDKNSFKDNFKNLILASREDSKLFDNVMFKDKNRFVSIKKVCKEFSL